MPTDGPERLSEILSRLIVQRGLGQTQQRQRLEDAWRTAAGTAWAERSKVGTFKGGQLEVIVADAVLHQELTFAVNRLLKELNAVLTATPVSKLKIRLGGL